MFSLADARAQAGRRELAIGEQAQNLSALADLEHSTWNI